MESCQFTDELFVTMVNEFISIRESISYLSSCFQQVLGIQGIDDHQNLYGQFDNVEKSFQLDDSSTPKGAIETVFPTVLSPIDFDKIAKSLAEQSITPLKAHETTSNLSNLYGSHRSLADHSSLGSDDDSSIKFVEREIFIESEETQMELVNEDHAISYVNDSVSRHCILPYQEMHGDAFKFFSADDLENSTEFTHFFSNRASVYYGSQSYTYGKTTHEPKDFAENPYLLKLLNYVDIVYPDIRYNSAMINLYKSGADFIPHHSDNEEDIVDDSIILTISLGSVRTIEFIDKKHPSWLNL